MLKYSLYIEPVLQEYSIYDRVQIAKDIGFDGIDIWNPLDFNCRRLSVEAEKADIPIIGTLFTDGLNKRLDMPTSDFIKVLEESIGYAKQLGAHLFIALGGDRRAKTDYQMTITEENLKRSADIITKNDIYIAVEALNTYVDHKGYLLDSSYKAYELIKRVGCPNIKTVFDCYHIQIMEGNLIANFTENIQHICHFHAAGVPGRHALNKGELNYNGIARAIEKTGFNGYMSFELWPADFNSLSSMLKYIK